MSLRVVLLVAGLALVLLAPPARAGNFPLFDAHIHYSHDAWQKLTPEEAEGIAWRNGEAVIASAFAAKPAEAGW